MCKKCLLVCCVSLLALAIFILDCTRQIYRPFSPNASVEVINVVINDSLGGNNDGELNPNETVGLLLQLKNIGHVDIPASEGLIFSNQRGINILDSTAAIPEILVGDTVWAVEEFIIMVDSSAIDESAAFFLTLNKTAQKMFVVTITYTIYACLDTCALIEGQDSTPDTILIRLSICNRSTSPPLAPWLPPVPEPLFGVAVEVPVNPITNTTTTMRICTTDLLIPATPVMEPVPGNPAIPLNKVFYETIGANSCGDPISCAVIPGSRDKEFRFTIPDGTLSTPSCIWFSANIWLNAVKSTTDCSITLPAGLPELTVIVYCRI